MDTDIEKEARRLHEIWRKDVINVLKNSEKQRDGSILFDVTRANSEQHRILKSASNKIYVDGFAMYFIDKSMVDHFRELSSLEFDCLPEDQQACARGAASCWIREGQAVNANHRNDLKYYANL